MVAKIKVNVPDNNMDNVPQVRDENFKQYSAPMQMVRVGPSIGIITFCHEEITQIPTGPQTPMQKMLVMDFEVAMPLNALEALKNSIEVEIGKIRGMMGGQ